MPLTRVDALRLLTSDPPRTGIFTDFDGTLSEIVDSPEDATAVAGAESTLERLAERFGLVAVVTGRALEDVRHRLHPAGVLLAGSYGRERSDRSEGRRQVEGWETVAAAAAAMTGELPGVVLEPKGAGVALHYRTAPGFEPEVRRAAERLAGDFELEVLHGRLVVELVSPGPKKGDAIAALVAERDLRTVLVAGDDVADVEAFEWVRRSRVRGVLVAVSSEEAPPTLEGAADLVLDGPAEVVALLRDLLAAV
ncbi:MAG: trehalose-phosphatase [Actinomycetota bacterium]